MTRFFYGRNRPRLTEEQLAEMTPQQRYLRGRLDDQIDWYDVRAFQNKLTFMALSAIAIGASAAIPVTISAGASEWIPAALGGLTTLVASLLAVLKSQENWIHYRSTADLLKRERAYFDMEAGPYSDEDLAMEDLDRDKALVERVEELISAEHGAWHRRRSGTHSSRAAQQVSSGDASSD